MGKVALGFVIALFGFGCGDDDSPNCPPDFPVERDGFCYRADDAGEDAFIPLDGSSDAGDEGDAGGDVGAPDAGDVDSGDVDSGDVDAGGDDGDAGGVDASTGDAGAICTGTHPIVEDGRRFCEAGDCFCATPDACFPAAIAATCCEVDVVCE